MPVATWACDREMSTVQLAKRALVVSAIFVGTVAFAFALWKIRVVIAMFFLGLIIAAAMRPGVDWLKRHHVPRPAGVLIYFLVLAGLVALFLYLVVPVISDQVTGALKATNGGSLQSSVAHSRGIKHEILVALQKRLKNLPAGPDLIHPAISVTKKVFEILAGVFFTFAVAAYWIFERDRTVRLVTSLTPAEGRQTVRETWDLIDARLGAFVRGELVLILFVGSLLSLAFWLIGEPYRLLIGIFAGLVEIVPVVGPLLAGALAVASGLTVSLHVALLAGAAVLAVRLLEDYLVSPRVLGRAVGFSPLLIMVAVFVVPFLIGPFYIIIALPILAVVATLVEVLVLDRESALEPAGEPARGP